MIVRDWLAAAALSRPQAPALTWETGTLTFVELNQQVGRWAARLAATGIRKGDHVGLLASTHADAASVIFALARLGAILVPLNTRLTPEELSYQIDKARCAVVLADSRHHASLPAASGETRIIRLEDLVGQPAPLKDSDLDGLYDFQATQAIVFTSGTTGKPKGAQITFGNHYFSAMGSAARIGVLPQDRWLVCLPLYHVGGLAILFRSLLYNTVSALMDAGGGFQPADIMRRIAQEPVTLVSLVPTMLWRMLDAGFTDPAHLRLILLGGAATSVELIERSRRLHLPIVTTYGMTEAASQVATLLPEGVYTRPGSVGQPLMFTQVEIVRPDGSSAVTDEIGEIVVSGPTVMRGYFDEQDDQKLADGRLHTGDLGYLDAEGALWVVQRRSDLIVSGGENIYPAEVEQILRQHPEVADVCVVGIADAEWGQKPAAAVVRTEASDLTEADLIAYARSRMAGYKVPRQYRFVDALPVTASGKVQRTAVQKLFAAANSSD